MDYATVILIVLFLLGLLSATYLMKWQIERNYKTDRIYALRSQLAYFEGNIARLSAEKDIASKKLQYALEEADKIKAEIQEIDKK